MSRGLGREGCGTQGLTGFSQLQRKGDWRAAGGLQKRVGLPVSSHSVGQGLRDSRGLASPLRGCEAGGRGGGASAFSRARRSRASGLAAGQKGHSDAVPGGEHSARVRRLRTPTWPPALVRVLESSPQFSLMDSWCLC